MRTPGLVRYLRHRVSLPIARPSTRSEYGVPEREGALCPPSSYALGFGPVARVAAEPLRPAVAATLVEVVVRLL